MCRTGTVGVQTNICGAEIHLRIQAHPSLCHMVFMSARMNARCGFDSTWVVNEPLGSIQYGFC